MFQKIEFNPAHGSVSGTLWLNSPVRALATNAPLHWRDRIHDWAERVDLVPDLGRDIGSATWWRGLITCFGLCGAAIALAPGMRPIPGAVPAPLSQPHFDQYRAQMINALALGADTGQRMGPTDMVVPLTSTPERPTIELDASLGNGGSFAGTLRRAGVSERDAEDALAMIAQAVDPAKIEAGTLVHIVLGRRPNRNVSRPLDGLALRPLLELKLDLKRVDGALAMTRIPIAVDNTPLRIRGRVGAGLYYAARAAGADPATIQSYLKVLATRLDIGSDLRGDDRFDIVVAHRRAATGETETGKLLFAGLERDAAKPINMLRWTMDGREQWFEASGVGENRGALSQPVSGRISSSYGERFHPILGYTRMHAGVDFAASYGSPIYAVTDGRVTFAGWHGGHGKYVQLSHAGGLGTGYGHMSRIAVAAGQSVKRGQVIGYVGSTGLSTGPHLHYELYRNGATVNPMSVKFTQVAQLSGQALAAFKARLSQLKSLPAGLGAMAAVTSEKPAAPAAAPASNAARTTG